MTHDTHRLGADACSEFLIDPVDDQSPEGAAIALLFVAVVCVLASLAAVWAIGMFL